MIKSLFFSLSLILLLLYSCNQQPTPIEQDPISTLPESPPATTTPRKSSGTMTNQPIEDMAPAVVNQDLMIAPKELLGYVQAAIIPSYKDWVLFKNGTYIIFDYIDTIPDIQQSALRYLAQYKPKTIADANWDFTISDLDQVEGWSVYGNGYGIYTFVHPTELSINPSPQQIGAYAKAKRALDEEKPKILFISSKDGILEIQ